ncbi:2Fe-2S iron-sulfur cluster-binding protein [Streptomyces sulphureus]|uniref:2Fe-2S iron-sulfur cluster-binding protein n=1 Tax=Streptomyces sulphureus TaxID=47758 RepID=UPI00036F1667|nr:2Fe-2S iron-sulfur cluster-binding protein [Streptomyces sulphureus]
MSNENDHDSTGAGGEAEHGGWQAPPPPHTPYEQQTPPSWGPGEDSDATAFVQLPPDLGAYQADPSASAGGPGTPLAAPGTGTGGYTPPTIDPAGPMTPAASTDPSATGQWVLPYAAEVPGGEAEARTHPYGGHDGAPEAPPHPGAYAGGPGYGPYAAQPPGVEGRFGGTPVDSGVPPVQAQQWHDAPGAAAYPEAEPDSASGHGPSGQGAAAALAGSHEARSRRPLGAGGGAAEGHAAHAEGGSPGAQPGGAPQGTGAYGAPVGPGVSNMPVEPAGWPSRTGPDGTVAPPSGGAGIPADGGTAASGQASGAEEPEGAGPGDETPHAGGSAEPPATGPGAGPDTGAVPEPDAGAVPRPDAGDAPRPGAGAVPRPGAGDAPEPDADDVPEPDAGDAPEPDAADGAEAADVPDVEAPSEALVDSEHPHVSYALRVNGVDRPVTDSWIGESLLYVLRERLGLAGAKDGCAQGECGACSVQVDGRLVASCLVPAATAAGSEVRTVEGLASEGTPSDVQRALAEGGFVQCGFCVPGLAMTVHDLLEGNHRPSELEVRQAICGNLCRCSGYRGILDAVGRVVAERAHAGEEDEGAEGEGAPEAQAEREAPPVAQIPQPQQPEPPAHQGQFVPPQTGEHPGGVPHGQGPHIPHQAPPGAGGAHPGPHDQGGRQ